TEEAEENCAVMVVDQIKDFLQNGNITNSVNFPEVVMQRGEGHRISIANSNVPNIVAQISTLLSNSGFNIVDMLNRSKKEYAYTLLDVDKEVSSEILEGIRKITGVLAVRYHK
ncbi:MAG: hypothetical protein KDK54_06070, partial [Leptospiraceae bacterium]|nr:hypothetical protein [Leptospiraceae bacterium]